MFTHEEARQEIAAAQEHMTAELIRRGHIVERSHRIDGRYLNFDFVRWGCLSRSYVGGCKAIALKFNHASGGLRWSEPGKIPVARLADALEARLALVKLEEEQHRTWATKRAKREATLSILQEDYPTLHSRIEATVDGYLKVTYSVLPEDEVKLRRVLDAIRKEQEQPHPAVAAG